MCDDESGRPPDSIPTVMPQLSSARRPSSRAELVDVFCPQCTYALEPWEIHLLKWLDCPFCGAQLELGTGADLALRRR